MKSGKLTVAQFREACEKMGAAGFAITPHELGRMLKRRPVPPTLAEIRRSLRKLAAEKPPP